jgi:hypothetical protein
MKNPNRATVSKLHELPNIGEAIARKLEAIGISHPEQLIGKSAYTLYDRLCEYTGEKVDPCVIDVIMSAIDFMEGGDPRPWWKFTDKRKAHLGHIK